VLPSLASLNIPASSNLSLDAALTIYEALRPIMPAAAPGAERVADRLTNIIPHFEALILDGFGVINVGTDPVDGIDDFLAVAADHGVTIMVLTNGATLETKMTAQKYTNWNLPIPPHHVVSSRNAFIRDFLEPGGFGQVGILSKQATAPLFDGMLSLADYEDGDADFWERADHFAFLSAGDWQEDDQAQLEAALQKRPRPVHIANPDVTSPQSTFYAPEPGYWAARLLQTCDVPVYWYGKPHQPAYNLAFDALREVAGRDIPRDRIGMVGDSLHTDILGASAAGIQSILLTSYGLFRDGGVAQAIERTDISPDWIVDKL
jgi:glycerol-1-phosphatase